MVNINGPKKSYVIKKVVNYGIYDICCIKEPYLLLMKLLIVATGTYSSPMPILDQ